MSYNKWQKRSAEKNYFLIPNEVFSIGLGFREISLYTYLLRCENRDTYQCYPSYKNIGKSIGMSENTVAKYVRSLEDKGLIYIEPTIVQSKDGRPIPSVRYRALSKRSMSGSSGRWRRTPHYTEQSSGSKSPTPKVARTPCARLSERKQAPVPARGLKPDLIRFLQTSAGRKKKQATCALSSIMVYIVASFSCFASKVCPDNLYRNRLISDRSPFLP